MTAIYNENDSFAVEWLERLIIAGMIAPGHVDARDIREIGPEAIDVPQAHFFAGIGGWSYALRLAGWPDTAPVWTGSCPCQPFSIAGPGKGKRDKRHLWPEFARLIRDCRPPVVFGEQVASPSGREWLDAVSADMEALGYAVGAADLCAASIGAPHIRQRLFFAAFRLGNADAVRSWWITGRDGEAETSGDSQGCASRRQRDSLGPSGQDRGLANTTSTRRAGFDAEEGVQDRQAWKVRIKPGRPSISNTIVANAVLSGCQSRRAEPDRQVPGCSPHGRMADGDGTRLQVRQGEHKDSREELTSAERASDPVSGVWGDAEWWPYTDHTCRPAQPGAFPLAHGFPRSLGRFSAEHPDVEELAAFTGEHLRAARKCRKGRLMGYGNAIVPQLAAEFIVAALDAWCDP